MNLTPPPPQPDLAGSLLRLNEIVKQLRLACPWDREQTIESLRHLSIEEVYELSEAILSGNREELKKELGDLLLHVFFYANIAEEEGSFGLKALTDTLCAKLIRRHPHVYGEAVANNSDQVKQTWEEVKLQEAKTEEGIKSVLKGVPAGLPALVKAYRIQEKAAGVGFDWPEVAGVFDKVREEIAELEEAREAKDAAAQAEEFGDLLFSLVNLGRHMNINPDDALELANRKFTRRFQDVEAQAVAKSVTIKDLGLDELETMWQAAKVSQG